MVAPLAGVLSWYQGDTRVVAVEPERSCCLRAALAAREVVDVEVAGSAADSLGARRVGDRAFALAQRHLHTSLTVTEGDIADAQSHLWENCRLATEPGGATAFAALLSGGYIPAAGERVGVIVCGGNVDPTTIDAATLRSTCRLAGRAGGAGPPPPGH